MGGGLPVAGYNSVDCISTNVAVDAGLDGRDAAARGDGLPRRRAPLLCGEGLPPRTAAKRGERAVHLQICWRIAPHCTSHVDRASSHVTHAAADGSERVITPHGHRLTALLSTPKSDRRGWHCSTHLSVHDTSPPGAQDGALEAHPAMGSADIILDLVRSNECHL